MPLSPAREIAYNAFVQVMEHGVSPEKATEKLLASAKGLKRLDHNFIKEVLFGSLRWYSKIYWILQNTSKRNLDDSTAEIRSALVLGTYQIFYMDKVPDRAAVNESVEYVRKVGQANACSFVNGILRQISRRAEYFTKPSPQTQPVEYLSLQFAHPKWIVERWHAQFKFDRCEKMLASNNKPPEWCVRVNLMKTPKDEIHKLQQTLLKKEKCHSDRRPLRCALRLKQAPDLSEGSLFAQGFYTIQDEASQLVGYMVDPKPDEKILDACAGKAVKLSQMHELSDGKAKLTAIEPKTAQQTAGAETLKRLGVDNTEWHVQDFLDFRPDEAPEKILIDAPCSGLGVLRRHPEGKWHKSVDILATMIVIQRKLLEHAVELLGEGGELIYSVCSFEPEETTAHIDWLKEKYPDKIEIISPVQRLPDYYKRYVTRQNLLLIYSGNQDEIDGFGAFILKKVK